MTEVTWDGVVCTLQYDRHVIVAWLLMMTNVCGVYNFCQVRLKSIPYSEIKNT